MQDELRECKAVLIQPGYLWLDEWMSQLVDGQPLLTLCPSTLSALYCLTKHPSLSWKLLSDDLLHQFAKFPSLSNIAPIDSIKK